MRLLKCLLVIVLLCCSLRAFESKARWIWRKGEKAEYE